MKDASGETAEAVRLAYRVLQLVDYFTPRWWVVENPRGRLGRLVPRLGAARLLSFDPWEFGDPYTKRTTLYGHFCPLLPRTIALKPVRATAAGHHSMDQVLCRSHPAASRAARRSVTPSGFARAFFAANP